MRRGGTLHGKRVQGLQIVYVDEQITFHFTKSCRNEVLLYR